MNKTCCVLATSLLLAFSSNCYCAKHDEDIGELADNIGLINAWRLIPEALLARCVKSDPKRAEALRQAYESWRTNNLSFANEISKVIDQAAPRFAVALSIEESEARKKMDQFTLTLVDENYFSGNEQSIQATCASYEGIVKSLSEPGRLAVTRGYMYSVEAVLSRQKPSPQ